MKTETKFGEVKNLLAQVKPNPDKVSFESIFENGNGGVVLLAFNKGQALSTHLAPAQVMVYVLEGEVEFTVIDNPRTIRSGEFLLMGEGVPHSVVANTDARVMLVKVKTPS